jgi:hypothetical protein
MYFNIILLFCQVGLEDNVVRVINPHHVALDA